MYFAYSVVTLLLVLVLTPYFAWQAVRYRKYVGSLPQRLGLLPLTINPDGDPSIWIHAVSVGEALTVRALIVAIRERYPRLRIYVSTTTIAGQQVARQQLKADGVFYFPFDWGVAVRRTLDIVQPRLFVMTETEIWPRLLHECRARRIRTLMVNGRISDRSYPRYRLVRRLFRRVLADVDRFCMQSEESARRIIALGADPASVTVTGSLKFDSLQPPSPVVQGRPREPVLRYFRLAPQRLVVVAGSTMKSEDAVVLRAFARVRSLAPGALLIVAPRHTDRFDEVVRLAREEGFSVARRSELPIDAEPRVDVVVLDTFGELAQVYQLATLAFVGGSLANYGGHNILEPAAFGKPIVVGPHMQNFAEITATFLAHDAVVQVQTPRALEETLRDLAANPARRAALGTAARALVEANRGALARTLDVVHDLLPAGGAVVRPFRRAL